MAAKALIEGLEYRGSSPGDPDTSAKAIQSSHRGLKGTVSGQSSSFCLVLPDTRPQSLWNLK